MIRDDLRRLRRLMARLDYLEVRERELREIVGALRQTTDRALGRRGGRLTDTEATAAASQTVELGKTEATLLLVRRQRARLTARLAYRSLDVRRKLAESRLRGD